MAFRLNLDLVLALGGAILVLALGPYQIRSPASFINYRLLYASNSLLSVYIYFDRCFPSSFYQSRLSEP